MPLLQGASETMLEYVDEVITCLEAVHERSFRSWRSMPVRKWPTIEGVERARHELHEDFKATSRYEGEE